MDVSAPPTDGIPVGDGMSSCEEVDNDCDEVMDPEQDHGDQCDQEREVSGEVSTGDLSVQAEEQEMSEENKKILQEIETEFEEIKKIFKQSNGQYSQSKTECFSILIVVCLLTEIIESVDL